MIVRIIKLTAILLLSCLFSVASVNSSAFGFVLNENKYIHIKTMAWGNDMSAGNTTNYKDAFGLHSVHVVNIKEVQVAYGIDFNQGHGDDHFDMDVIGLLDMNLNFANVWDFPWDINWKQEFVGGTDHYANVK